MCTMYCLGTIIDAFFSMLISKSKSNFMFPNKVLVSYVPDCYTLLFNVQFKDTETITLQCQLFLQLTLECYIKCVIENNF